MLGGRSECVFESRGNISKRMSKRKWLKKAKILYCNFKNESWINQEKKKTISYNTLYVEFDCRIMLIVDGSSFEKIVKALQEMVDPRWCLCCIQSLSHFLLSLLVIILTKDSSVGMMKCSTCFFCYCQPCIRLYQLGWANSSYGFTFFLSRLGRCLRRFFLKQATLDRVKNYSPLATTQYRTWVWAKHRTYILVFFFSRVFLKIHFFKRFISYHISLNIYTIF
jgi:hypothetical protein